MVHCNNEAWTAKGVDCGNELRQLLRIDIVPGEKDDSTYEGMPHQLGLIGRNGRADEVDHQRPETHPGRPLRLPGSRIAMDSTWVVCGNMSNTPAAMRLIPCSCTSNPRS